MTSEAGEGTAGARGVPHRGQLTTAIRESLRELNVQLSLVSHHVAVHLSLNDVDLDCLDLIELRGPMSPSALARRAGLHPATITGVLDRLERAGWVVRERDAADRRAISVRAVEGRSPEVHRLYATMNSRVSQICAGYSDADLDIIADFLRRTAAAGRHAADELAGQ